MLHGRGLLLDENREFINVIQDDPQEDLPITCVKTVREALMVVNNAHSAITVVFIATTAGVKPAIEFMKTVKEKRPGLPFVLLDHFKTPRLSNDEAIEAGCLGLVHVPQNVSDLLSVLKQHMERQGNWKSVAPDPASKDVELEKTDKDFVAAPLRDYVFTQRSYFNLFLKLAAGKYVKVLNAGDTMDENFLEKMKKKGVVDFFISQDEHLRYMHFCEQLITKHSGTPSAKVTQIVNLGENIKNSLYQTGITVEKLHYADNFLGHAVQLARMARMGDKKMSSMIDSLLGRDHVAVTVMMSGMLANELGLESTKAVKLVGMAALFHDIGLYDLLPHLSDEDPAKLSPEEKLLWDKHPVRGEEILRGFGGLDEMVYQATLHHHLRKRGNVGERRLSNISTVSEIVGCCDAFQNMVLGSTFDFSRLKRFKEVELKTFSPQIEKAFLKILGITV